MIRWADSSSPDYAEVYSGALSGLKVLDLSRVLAGPFSAQLMADMGAEVIKIEAPGGDNTRDWGPPFINEVAAYFYTANRNKKIYRADFHNKAALEQIKDLAQSADVIIENFLPGKLEKFGLDYASIKTTNTRVIYCAITGFGQTGPCSNKPGYDAMMQACGGFMSITGPDKEHPSKVGVPIVDLTTGLYSTVGILAALQERHKSNEGQFIDLSLMDTQVSLLNNVALNYLCTNQVPSPMGNAHPNIVPYQTVETLDGQMFLGIGNDRQFAKLCDLLEVNWHEDTRFLSNAERIENREELSERLHEKFKTQTQNAWSKSLEKAGLPCESVNDLEDISQHPHVTEKQLFRTLENSKIPTLKNPLNFSRTPVLYRPPKELGDVND